LNLYTCVHAICKNNELKNDSIWTSYTHVFSCNAYMIIAITKWPMKNFMNIYVKLDFMMYDVNYYLHFWYNSQYTTRLWLQLCWFDYIFTSYAKITRVKYKVMDIYSPNHILNNITICLIGGCIRHEILLLSYAICCVMS